MIVASSARVVLPAGANTLPGLPLTRPDLVQYATPSTAQLEILALSANSLIAALSAETSSPDSLR